MRIQIFVSEFFESTDGFLLTYNMCMSNFETTLDFAFVRYENTTRDQTPLERLLSSSMSKLIRCTKLPKRIAHFHKNQQISIITSLHYFFVTFVLIELELLLPIDAQPSAAFTFYKGQ